MGDWEVLYEDDLPAVSDALARVAAQPFAARWPFFAAAEAHARHADPRARAAALRVLAGADGLVAEQVLVRGLRDGDAQVRAAALDALQRLPAGAADRWVFAVAHDDPAVRRAALDRLFEGAGLPGWLWPRWLADPEVGPVLRARLTDAPAHIDALGPLLAHHHAGQVDLDAVIDWAAKLDWAGSLIAITALLPEVRPTPAPEAPHAAALDEATLAAAAVTDPLDPVLDGLVTRHPGVLAALAEPAVRNKLPTAAELRLQHALLARVGRGLRPTDAEVLLLAARWPSVLGWPRLPMEGRRAALPRLAAWTRRGAGVPVGHLGLPALLGTGPVDATALRALLAITAPDALGALADAIGPARLLELVRSDAAAVATLLGSGAARDRVLALLAATEPDHHLALLASILLKSPEAGAAVVVALTLAEKGRLVRTLDGLDGDGPALGAAASAIASDPGFALAVLADPAPIGPAGRAILTKYLRTAAPPKVIADLAEPLLVRLADLDRGWGLAPWSTLLEIGAQLPPPVAARLGWTEAPVVVAPLRPEGPPRDLDHAEAAAIRAADDLDAALETALGASTRGITTALLARPPSPSPAACAAALASPDPWPLIAAVLARFGGDDPAVDPLVAPWAHRAERSRAASLWLFRWEGPRDEALAAAEAEPGGLVGLLRDAAAWEGDALRRRAWASLRAAAAQWRWRDPARLAALDPAVVALAAATLADPAVGDDARAVLDAHGAPAVRRVLRGAPAPAPSRLPGDPAPLVTALRTGVAVDPALDPLLALGAAGAAALLAELARADSPVPARISATIVRWPDGPALDGLLALVGPRAAGPDAVASPRLPARARLAIAIGLAERARARGDASLVARAVDAALDAIDAADATATARLLAVADEPVAVARRLALGPAAAAEPAVARLAAAGARAALAEAFHGAGAPAVRLAAAVALLRLGDARGAVDVATSRLTPGATPEAAKGWCAGLPTDLVATLARSATIAGPSNFSPFQVLAGVDGDARFAHIDAVAAEVLEGARAPQPQAEALKRLGERMHGSWLVHQLADLVLWGRDQSRRLLGRAYGIELLGGDALGWTRLEQRTIHVNPVAMLRGERDGEDIARGLIVHELGHHLYNADEAGKAIWKQANEQGLARLHNLVCDEHLERNLRAIDAGYGDHLKRLAAWAFQHAQRSLPVAGLVAALGVQAVPVLIRARLDVSRKPLHVEIGVGELMQAFTKNNGHFAPFVRALRMGLGDRTGDPVVRAALDLFGPKFRDLDNAGLWQVTLALRDLFGDEVKQLDHFDLHDTSCDDGGEGTTASGGVTAAQVKREVERREGTPKAAPSGPRPGASGAGGADRANLGAASDFYRITEVRVLPFDPVAHRLLVADVARPARALRRVLERLGLRQVPVRPRLSGFRLDKGRLVALAVRQEPRVLIARQTEVQSDLFVGVVVDCSGSMGTGGRMDRARRFAALLAEACRDLPGVDLRIFGFTDKVIFDAGDAKHPAAHALVANGGNNDAAGLHHVAQVARRSGRKNHLLIMISDGVPTECTTTALTNLVRLLERKHRFACAQVAVERISTRCFDTYLEVLDNDVAIAVRAFARIIERLVTKTLSRNR